MQDWQTRMKNVILCRMTFFKGMRSLNMGNAACNR